MGRLAARLTTRAFKGLRMTDEKSGLQRFSGAGFPWATGPFCPGLAGWQLAFPIHPDPDFDVDPGVNGRDCHLGVLAPDRASLRADPP
ncbi:hypothetical protein CCP4SC76_190004 [Gammaproteobacteria bacterium]